MLRLAAGLLAVFLAAFLAVSLAAILGAATPAAAAPLTFFISGKGAGTVNDVAFDGRFKFILRGELENYVSEFGVSIYDPLSSAVLRIDGVGTAAFTDSTRLGYQAREKAIFFSRPSGRDLFDFRVDGPVDLTRPFAAMIGRNVFALNQFVDVPTSLGRIDFSRSSDVRFAAVPLPAAAPLLLAALAGLGALGLRRRRRAALPA